ncbi:MAG: ABC transporter permease [Bdellovibrionia bacterium]
MRVWERWMAALVWGWTLGFILLCLVIPLSTLLGHALGGLTTPGWSDSWTWGVFRCTAGLALKSALLSGVLGTALGLALAQGLDGSLTPGGFFKRFSLRFFIFLRSLLLIPYSVPTVVAAQTWVIWLGRSGVLSSLLAPWGIQVDLLYSAQAVIWAQVFFNVPWVAHQVLQARVLLPETWIEAAKTLGASSMQITGRLIFPALSGVILTSLLQVFSVCTMSFGLVLLLGGGPPVQTLEVELVQSLRENPLDLSRPVFFALLELLLSCAPWFLILLLRRFGKENTWQGHDVKAFGFIEPVPSMSPRAWALLGCALFFVLPYGSVFWGSTLFHRASETQWHSGLTALKNSLFLAGLSGGLTCLSATFAMLAMVHLPQSLRWLQTSLVFLLSLPSGISILVLALGFWFSYGLWVDPFEGSFLIIALIQMTSFMPLAIRMLFPLLGTLQSPLHEAAQTLGASSFQSFLILNWPRLRSTVISV